MSIVTTSDGTEIHYKDWGEGQPVVLSHGWPLNSDSWEAQMLFLASNGFRCIAHDRRGHGRSTQTWDGNEMDTYADDLAALIETLDLRDVTLVGFSTGGGEVARYIGRHGTGAGRQGRAGLRGAAVHAADRRQPRRRPDRGLRRDPRRLARRPLAALPGPRRRPVLRPQPPGRRRLAGHPRRLLAAGHAVRAPQRATSASRRSRRPTSATTWRSSTCRRSSSTATTTRSCRSSVGGQASAALIDARDADRLPGRPARHHRHPQGAARQRPARVPQLDGRFRSSSAPRPERTTHEHRRTTPDTIVLIHGFWVTPRSWEDWIARYESRGLPRPRPRLSRLRGRGRGTERRPHADREADGSGGHRAPRVGRRRARRASDPDGSFRRRRVHAAPDGSRLRRGRRRDQLGADRRRQARAAVADQGDVPRAQEPRQPPQGRRVHLRAVALRVHEHVQRGGGAEAVRAVPHPRVRPGLLGQRAREHPSRARRHVRELREPRPCAAPLHFGQRGPPHAAVAPALECEALQGGRDDHRGQGVRGPLASHALAGGLGGGRRLRARPGPSSTREGRPRAEPRERRPRHAHRWADDADRGRRLAPAHRSDVRSARRTLRLRLGHVVAQAGRARDRRRRARARSTPCC